jgi:hypothetical protein
MAMKLLFASLMCLALTGCGRAEQASGDDRQSITKGRYAGVGVFEAGRLWGKMIVPQAKADEATARLTDDEHVIVVIDSQTGEVRQCGDHTGYCVSISPWNAANGSGITLPARLSAHGEDEHAAITGPAARDTVQK